MATTKQRLTALSLALVIAGGFWLARETWHARGAHLYNEAVVASNWERASRYGDDRGRFAQGYQLQSRGQRKQALKHYATLEQSDDVVVARAARFNLANVYLQLATKMQAEQQTDLALPLVELAKQSYRQLLRADPGHWDAKYNLERALQLFPDPQEQAIQEWQAPERSQRALVTFEIDQALP